MALKPTSFVDWATASTSYRIEPTAGKKLTGFAYLEKPTRQAWNWLTWNLGMWSRWFSDIYSGYYQVGLGTSDYSDINTAMTATKNKLILVIDSPLSSQIFTMSDGYLKTNGAKITNSTTNSVLEIQGSNNDIEVIIENTNTIVDALLISGNNNKVKVRIIQNLGGFTMTNAIHITGNTNQIDAVVVALAGTIANVVTDSGTDNDYRIVYSI